MAKNHENPFAKGGKDEEAGSSRHGKRKLMKRKKRGRG